MLPCEVWDRLGALRQEEMLAVLAAFFCLLFFAAAKKSRCRPAQGRRVKHANKTRMPAKPQANQTACATTTTSRSQRNGKTTKPPAPRIRNREHQSKPPSRRRQKPNLHNN